MLGMVHAHDDIDRILEDQERVNQGNDAGGQYARQGLAPHQLAQARAHQGKDQNENDQDSGRLPLVLGNLLV